LLKTNLDELGEDASDWQNYLVSAGTEGGLAVVGGVLLAGIGKIFKAKKVVSEGAEGAVEESPNLATVADEVAARLKDLEASPASVNDNVVLDTAVEGAPVTRALNPDEVRSNPVLRQQAEQLEIRSQQIDNGIDPLQGVRRGDAEVKQTYTSYSPLEATNIVADVPRSPIEPVVISKGSDQAAIRTAAADTIQRVREVLIKRTDAPYGSDAKSNQLLKNFLGRPYALRQAIRGTEVAFSLMKAGREADEVFDAIRRATDIEGLDDTSKAIMQRMISRRMSEMAFEDAKAIYKAIKEGGYVGSTRETAEKLGIEQVDNWMNLIDESRFIGRGFSLGLRNTGSVALKEVDRAIDDALDQVKLDATGKAKTRKQKLADRSKDLTREGFERARQRGFDIGESLEMAEDFARDLSQFPDVAGRNIDQADLERTVWEKIFGLAKEIYVTNILSNPATITINIVSTLTNSIARPAYKIIGGAASGNSTLALKGLREFAGHFYALKASAKMAALSWKQRDGVLEAFQLADLRYKPLNSVPGQPVRNLAKRIYTASIDAQTATDEFFKQMRYRGVRYAEAHEIAAHRGLNARETKKFVKQYIKDGFNEHGLGTDPVTLAEAQRTAFQTPWGGESGRGGALGDAIRGLEQSRRGDDLKGLLATMVFPFVRTPTNLVAEMFNQINPTVLVNVLRKADDSALAAELRVMRRGQFMFGATTGAAFYTAQENGLVFITGSQESYWLNAKQERQLIPSNSIVLGDKAYSLATFAPFSAPLYLIGAYNDVIRNADANARVGTPNNLNADAVETAAALGGTLWGFIGQAPMLTGLQSIVGLIDVTGTGDPDRISKNLGRLSSGFTNPGHLKFGLRLWEDDIYEYTDAMDYLFGDYKRLLPDLGTADRDVLGNKMTHSSNLLRARDLPSEPGAYLLYALLKDPNTDKGFLPQGPRAVFRGSKLADGINLSKLEGEGTMTAWENYKEFLYDSEAEADVEHGSSGRAASTAVGVLAVKKGETWGEAVNRLATDPVFSRFDPVTQADVLKKAQRHFKEIAKDKTKELPAVKAALEEQDSTKAGKLAAARERTRQLTTVGADQVSLSPLKQTLQDFGLSQN